MHKKKNIIIRGLHWLFSVLPNKALCIFGNCKDSCGQMCMEEDISDIQSTNLKLHLSICKKCWNYYHQMNLVNEAVTQNIDNHAGKELEKISTSKEIDSIAAKYSRQQSTAKHELEQM